VKHIKEKTLEVVTKEEIYQAKIKLWETIKPLMDY
jgi:hypothetical protein